MKTATLIIDGCGPVSYEDFNEGYKAFLDAYDGEARAAKLYNAKREFPIFIFNKDAPPLEMQPLGVDIEIEE